MRAVRPYIDQPNWNCRPKPVVRTDQLLALKQPLIETRRSSPSADELRTATDHQRDRAWISFALMSTFAKLASIELRARARRTSSDQPNALLQSAYSPSKLAPSNTGSSVLIDSTTPARRSRSIG